jgi:20S proteasome subunit alpha 4
MGYDRAATMFAPDGHILQVEYAEKTIRLGSATLGIVCKDAVIIVSDRRQKDKLVVEGSANKIYEIDDDAGNYSDYLEDILYKHPVDYLYKEFKKIKL